MLARRGNMSGYAIALYSLFSNLQYYLYLENKGADSYNREIFIVLDFL
jgi:hypothetical protein